LTGKRRIPILCAEVIELPIAERFVAEPPPLRMTEHGVILVGKTRVPLDTVVGEFQDGATPEEIALNFSSLDLADIYGAISFYLRHRSEVEEYLEQRRQRGEEMRRENEARFPSHGLRERLLARRKAQQQG
jgi:uncharacterized protein (DUF433 family)